ncbi:MAG TPA: hypothetical protein VG900_02100 [Hyphomicrobiaceae bacterium]|jgi:hypothetical protein|nr:hypothetical protein [Hyphomicrobiaceae bacterium]
MPEWIYAGGDNELWIFLLVTVAMGGSAAFTTGRAVAHTWRPLWHIPVYMLGIAAAVRFFHYALFGEPLLSLPSFIVDFAVAVLAAGAGYRITRVNQMARQYGWLYRRVGPLHWRPAAARAAGKPPHKSA